MTEIMTAVLVTVAAALIERLAVRFLGHLWGRLRPTAV